VFQDVSLQRPDLEPELYSADPNLTWRSADADGDPFVPFAALVEMERRFKSSQAKIGMLQLAMANTNIHTSVPPPTVVSLTSTGNNDNLAEQQVGGPGASSPVTELLKNLGQTPPSMEQEFNEEEDLAPHQAVGYRPSVKEARQLGLPSNLNLPDIAALGTRLPANLNLPDIASTPIKPAHSSTTPPLLSLAEATRFNESSLAEEEDAEGDGRGAPVDKKRYEEDALRAAATPGKPLPLTSSGGASPKDEDTVRTSLLAAIRGQPGQSSLRQSRQSPTRAKSAVPGAQLSLADEMREKLLRRQKALSGERDEEEQLALAPASTKAGFEEDSGSSSSSSPPPLPTMPKRLSNSRRDKRQRDPPPPSSSQADDDFVARRYAGIDVLLTRELAKLPTKKPSTSKSTVSGGSEWDAR